MNRVKSELPSKEYIKQVNEQCTKDHKALQFAKLSPLQKSRRNAMYCGGVGHQKKKAEAIKLRKASIMADLILLQSNLDAWRKTHTKIMSTADGTVTYKQLEREKLKTAIAMATQKITVLESQMMKVTLRAESMCGTGSSNKPSL